MTVPVTLYTRAGCHLCEEAAASLEAIARDIPIEVTPVDVDLDMELLHRFNDLVPVVAVADEVVTTAPIDLDAIRRAITVAIEGARTT